jgi:DNA-binding transcriptional ArsR family regulator
LPKSEQENSTRQTAAIFSALAHPLRREILLVLNFRGGSMSAGEIAARFSCRWPTTTRHLRVLQQAGLVRVEKHGRRRMYELNAKLLQQLVGQWLSWFAQKLKASKGKQRKPY